MGGLRSIALGFLIYILYQIKNKFNDIILKKESFKETRRRQKHKQKQQDSRQITVSKLRESRLQNNRHHRSTKIPSIYSRSKPRDQSPNNPLLPKQKKSKLNLSSKILLGHEIEDGIECKEYVDVSNTDEVEVHEKSQTHTYAGSLNVESPQSQTQTHLTLTNPALDEQINGNMGKVKGIGKATANSNAGTVVMSAGSVNSVMSHSGKVIKGEIARMNKLIFGLCLCICAFLLNASFNTFRANEELYRYFGLHDEDIISLYSNIYVITFVFFPQWVVINGFVMMFS